MEIRPGYKRLTMGFGPEEGVVKVGTPVTLGIGGPVIGRVVEVIPPSGRWNLSDAVLEIEEAAYKQVMSNINELQFSEPRAVSCT